MRQLPYLLFLYFLSCSTDSLEVRTVEVDDPKVSGSLKAAPVAAGSVAGSGELLILEGHEELSLSFDFKASAGAKAELLLQGKYPLSLPDFAVGAQDAKTTVPVDGSPGIWQELDLRFLPAGPDNPPMIASLYVNGNLMYYQQVLAEVDGTPGPLLLRGKSGDIEVENIRFGDRAGMPSSLNPDGSVNLRIPLIRYAYYELEPGQDEVADYGKLTAKKSGFTNRFDLSSIFERETDYAIRFSGKFQVPRAGEYTFRPVSPTNGDLYIDGKLVFDHPVEYGHQGHTYEAIQLSEGEHELGYDYLQTGNWNYLAMSYVDPTGKQHMFHNMTNTADLALPGTGQVLEVETDNEPYLLRSFLLFPQPRVYEEGRKLTHVLSAGEANGPHYSLDLNSGALLLAWRGKFLNVREMWDGRGEPQTAAPLGSTISLDARPQWFESGETRWPDSLADGTFHHLRYELDGGGRPTYFYEYDRNTVSDRFDPGPDGLTRTLTNRDGPEALFTQLASARSITQTAPGAFELRGPGATLSIIDNTGNELILQRGEGRSRLLSRLAPGSSVSYTLNW